MTQTSPTSTEGVTARYEVIVHDVVDGSIRIELAGHLDIWVGHEQHLVTPAVVALQAGECPEAVISEHFPSWESLLWVDPGWFPPAPADILAGAGGHYIALGPPHGKLMEDAELITAFNDWMLAWEAEERAMACAEEDEDAARDRVESKQPLSNRFGLGVFVVTAGLLYLTYDAFKIFIPAEITKREPIGVLVSAHASSDWSFPWLLETDRGLYPVGKVLMIDKGAPLTLIALSNGRHAVCDERLEVCARTVGEERRIAIKAGVQ